VVPSHGKSPVTTHI